MSSTLHQFTIFLCFSFSLSFQQNPRETLRAATIIMRHGDRNPIRSYPGDLYSNQSAYWPEGYGALIPDGKLRMYNLGWYMRRRYPTFQRKNVVVYSSDRNRTITSAMANLAGFYGQNRSFLKHVDTFNPRGFGIRVVSKVDDDFITLTQDCPKFDKLKDEYLNKTRPLEKYKDSVKIINENTGLNFTKLDENIYIFADTVIIQKSRGFQLQDWIEDLYKDDVFFEIRDEFFLNYIPTLELQRLMTGGMVKRFSREMERVASGRDWGEDISPPIREFPQITIISGHDITLVSWLIDFEVYDGEAPPYGAALFLELYDALTHPTSTTTELIIKVFYKRDSDKDPVLMSLPKCPNPCKYANFKRLLTPLALDNRFEECRNMTGKSNGNVERKRVEQHDDYHKDRVKEGNSDKRQTPGTQGKSNGSRVLIPSLPIQLLQVIIVSSVFQSFRFTLH